MSPVVSLSVRCQRVYTLQSLIQSHFTAAPSVGKMDERARYLIADTGSPNADWCKLARDQVAAARAVPATAAGQRALRGLLRPGDDEAVTHQERYVQDHLGLRPTEEPPTPAPPTEGEAPTEPMSPAADDDEPPTP